MKTGIKVTLDTDNTELARLFKKALELDSTKNVQIPFEGMMYEARLGGNVVCVTTDKIIGGWNKTPVTLASIAERCSHFSGWKLKCKLEARDYGRILTFWDPKDYGKSSLVLSDLYGCLHEVSGRLWNWNITPEEQEVMLAALSTKAVGEVLPQDEQEKWMNE